MHNLFTAVIYFLLLFVNLDWAISSIQFNPLQNVCSRSVTTWCRIQVALDQVSLEGGRVSLEGTEQKAAHFISPQIAVLMGCLQVKSCIIASVAVMRDVHPIFYSELHLIIVQSQSESVKCAVTLMCYIPRSHNPDCHLKLRGVFC